MRRDDREMDKEFALYVIDKARYGVLSMVDKEGNPYGLPLSLVRSGNNLYFHSAQEGRKVGILKENSLVSLAFVGDVRVPENYSKEELEEIGRDESRASELTSNVFTTEYESALVFGEISLIKDQGEKLQAMKLICEKYTPSKMDYFQMAAKSGLGKANIYKIKIKDIKGKRKKYDSQGQEMKFGRME